MKKKASISSRKTGMKATKAPEWNLGLLYATPTSPEIEKDMSAIEAQHAAFAKRFDTPERTFTRDAAELKNALEEFEKLLAIGFPKPLMYFMFRRDLDASDPIANSQIPLLTSRLAKAENLVTFFEVSLGQISRADQEKFLADPSLVKYRFYLRCVFDDARHMLSIAEEKIMTLKSQPAYDMWVSQNQRILNQLSVDWHKKKLPLAQALNMITSLPTAKERSSLAAAVNVVLETVAPFSEGEINAIITNKKINDELRGFEKPHHHTVQMYRNDPAVVDRLVETVTKHFKVAHTFFAIKARLLKSKKLAYSDRAARIGTIKASFTYAEAEKRVRAVFNSIAPKYAEILDSFIKNGQIDAIPKKGKKSGAYCWGSYGKPTFVLLNHIGDLRSFTTYAHEMGHAFHSELSKKEQGALYCGYSTALAETASTLFESIALESIFDELSDKEKIIFLHDKINDDISTIFRQIACFNFEYALHKTIRAKGFLTKEEIGALHNTHMQAYLGPQFKLTPADGNMFVQWSHIRRFFYVYSYAYGMLVSKALLRRYRADKSFWTKIEQFLSAGGKDTPENIMKEIGIDIAAPGFFEDGLKEIEDDIAKLEQLTMKKRS